MNKILSICIPTYNRDYKLKSCIEDLLPQLIPNKIPIYISDNASTDSTESVVAELAKIYSLVFYSRNSQNFGADYNISFAPTLAESKFVWLLGDDDRIAPGTLDKILPILEGNEYDLVVVNGGNATVTSDGLTVHGNIDGLSDTVYADRDKLLTDIGWYMTWISSLIYSSDLVNKGRFDKYQNTYLVQFGGTFDYLSKETISVFWYSEPSVYYASYASLDYNDKLFLIYLKNWFEVVSSLPDAYSEDAKKACLIKLGRNGGVLSPASFYHLRKNGFYNYQIYRQYSRNLPSVTDTPKWLALVIALIPVGLMKAIRSLRKMLKV